MVQKIRVFGSTTINGNANTYVGPFGQIVVAANGQISVSDNATPGGQTIPINTSTAAVAFVIDGGGSAITTGVKGDLTIPFACTVNSWTVLADQSGSIAIDVWKNTLSNYPPVSGNTIVGSDKPTITSNTYATSSALTGWTKTINANDTLRFNVDTASTVQRVTLSLKVTRT